ncbi:phosphatase PAP2 family protein [uncultured Draconibacterium sp.]|uniref:acid phosphatase n=1 Tax=uncultured Draconibacterium sp. TaxID=1573823 RepID=UPI002AA700CB|nr:phosphatase PAP2 family protein [uncultured Draconibacterium sp.]
MKNHIASRILIVSLFLFFAFGCTQPSKVEVAPATSLSLEVKEVRPGILQGYLSETEFPDSYALLPPPPTEGSIAWQLDQEKAAYFVALDDEERKQQAIQDADLSFPAALKAFNPVLPVKISEETTPVTYLLIRRTLADAGLSTYAAKTHYQRPRPFMVNNTPICTPEEEEVLRKDGSYPSGHTAVGWAWALILTELFPDQTDAILHRGKEFGISRNVCNVHWHSDVEAGRTMGAVTVARLHANTQFLIDIKAAKREIQSLKK